MVFRRRGSKMWYLGPLRAGGVSVPRLSTGVRDKATASAIERSLHDLAVTGWDDLVRRAASGDLSLIDLYTAKIRGREALDELRRQAEDPPLADRVAEFRPILRDERAGHGLDQLLALAPDDARLSWLRTPKNLTAMYSRAEADGQRSNTVRRGLHRAVSALLAHEIGRGQMLAVMADVQVPSGDDERRVLLTVEEARKALALCDDEFRPILGYVLTTGIDRLPMLTQRIYHFDEQAGTITVPDTKAKDRTRTLSLRGEPVLENAEYWLRFLAAGYSPADRLVRLTQQQIRTRWAAVRTALGRKDVRWKDLRGIFATYYLLAGGEVRDLQAILGHSGMAMTLRYVKRLPAGNRKSLREHARQFGLPGEGRHLKVAGGAA